MAGHVRWFSDLTIEDVPVVGGKNASLGEMYRELAPLGVRQANGFAVTAEAYRASLDAAGAWDRLHRELDGLDKTDVTALRRAGAACREIVYAAGLLPQTRDEILAGMDGLKAEYGPDISVAVRSSATAEDLPTASFAGQHDTYLNIRGDEMVLDAVRRCNASLFTDRAISYRMDKGFDHFKVYLSACVMKMVRSDLASAGVMFTVDTESGHPDFVFITGALGLGENVVQGAVDVDEFLVHKPRFRDGHRALVRRVLGAKQMKMVYAGGRTREAVVNRPTSDEERGRFCVTDDQVLTLADYAIKIEDHYSRHHGHTTPMDIEWALDGVDGELYIVQARPETVTSQADARVLEEHVVTGTGTTRVQGRAVGTKCATGAVRVIRNAEELPAFRPGEVLVSDTTTPDWEPVMKTAAAIVTNRGGRTCHAAIVARELGIPAVVGADGATATLKTGEVVTISCAEGDVGRVYAGEVPYEVRRTDLETIKRPPAHVMVNLGNPELALKTSFLPVDGVGLARLEFIINEYIKAHPMALLYPEKVADAGQRAEIGRMIAHHDNGGDFFVEKLAEGVGTIAAAFWPRPVIARLSDFKSNEYAALIGGAEFEPKEENPMIGFRGAARYTHPSFAEAFVLECRAMTRVREEMGLTNLKLMVPFCRRVDEADRVIAFMAEHGLKRGENGLEVYVMCEIPNNVISIDDFAKRFDGFSIGSNDLTQLTLGVDRDSQLVAFDFDERDPGVMAFLKQAVDGAKRNGRHVGICGQAPSDYPEMAEFLVGCGIDSISLTPDSVLRTLQMLAELDPAPAG
ncbi:MAG: phosphoenolpyruvate synthase [Rhodobacteraceae bacterium]|nr:phosphoenolpyruvate synthase [Paracoccaceae bacterium]